MDKQQKQDKAAELRQELAGVSSFVLIEFGGLSVAAANSLRGKFRDAGCSYRVHKNSTVRFAITETPLAAAVPLLRGVSGLAFHREDPGAPARVARDFAKENEALRVKGGVLDGAALDAIGVGRLADLPGPLELKAQLLRLLNTPATQMVRVLNAAAQSLLNVLNARKDQVAGA